jgi:hypothetical protein
VKTKMTARQKLLLDVVEKATENSFKAVNKKTGVMVDVLPLKTLNVIINSLWQRKKG